MFAFLFPGQGSQSLGMLGELAAAFPEVQNTFAEASEVLGYNLWDLTQNGPEDKLNDTTQTQPALLTASVAIFRVWEAQGGATPDFMAGHSLGEYSALVCADSMAFRDAVEVVAARGAYMQSAVPKGEGAMAAIIGLDDDAVRELCDEVRESDVLEPVNFNAVGQVIVAGNTAAVDRAIAQAKPKGARMAKALAVSVPSHCALMLPAAKQLEEKLEAVTLTVPSIPVINNVDVEIAENPAAIKAALVRQLSSPVRWVETIRLMVEQHVTATAECGPGNVLQGLNKRIDKSISSCSLATPDAITEGLTTLTPETLKESAQ